MAMHANPLRKASVAAIGSFVLLALVLAGAGPASAAQGRPSWSTGDTWSYTITTGGPGSVVWTVREQTTLTIGGTSYQVWNTTEAVSMSSGGTTITLTSDLWITPEMRQAKDLTTIPFLGSITTTYEPPLPLAVFPLAVGSEWSGSVTAHTTSLFGSSDEIQQYSGRVTDERSVTVPAGTFTAAAVRIPAQGNPYTLSYYSEAVGFMVKVESYNSGGSLTQVQELSSHRYSGGGLGLLLLVVGGLVAVLVIAAVVLFMMRRRRMPGMMPPGQPPYQPPYPPPTQPPQGPPPGM